jgi:hypothetical protein
MSKRLPENPSLEHLRKQARQLLNDIKAGDEDACSRVDLHPKYLYESFTVHEVQALQLTLRDAQLVVAREYRHKTWAELAEKVSKINAMGEMSPELQMILDDRVGDLRSVLERDPGLVRKRFEWLTRWNHFENGSLLAFACGPGSIEMMQMIVDCGADPEELAGGFFGSCENLNLEQMRKLVAIGLDPNKAFNEGWNCDVLHGCLQTYTRRSDPEHFHNCINTLIDAGAKFGGGPMWDLLRGREDVLRERLQSDKDLVNQRFDFDYGNHLFLTGATLLHLAVDYNLRWAVELLLEQGADIDAISVGAYGVGGQSPIFHSIGTNSGTCYTLFEYLLEKGVDLGVRARIAVDEERDGIVMHLLREGIIPESTEIREMTPLGYALWYEKGPSWRESSREAQALREMGAPE